jgi:hypothetical protein
VCVPLSNIVDGAPTFLPSRMSGLSMRLGGTIEVCSGPTVSSQRDCGVSDVQVTFATESEKNSSRLRRARQSLSILIDHTHDLVFNQDEAIIIGPPQEDRTVHPGHPSRGFTFWFLMGRTLAPSMLRVRNRGETSPFSQSMIMSMARAEADIGAETA